MDSVDIERAKVVAIIKEKYRIKEEQKKIILKEKKIRKK